MNDLEEYQISNGKAQKILPGRLETISVANASEAGVDDVV